MTLGGGTGAALRSGLPRHEMWVLVALMGTMESDGTGSPGVSTASVPIIASLARLSERTTQRALSSLVALGWLQRSDQPGRGSTWCYAGPPADVTPAPQSPPRRSHHRTPDTGVTPTPVSTGHHTPARLTPHPRTPDTGPSPIERARHAVPSSDPFLGEQQQQPRACEPAREATTTTTGPPLGALALEQFRLSRTTGRNGATVLSALHVHAVMAIVTDFGEAEVVAAIGEAAESATGDFAPRYVRSICERRRDDPAGLRRTAASSGRNRGHARASPSTADPRESARASALAQYPYLSRDPEELERMVNMFTGESPETGGGNA